MAKTKDKRQKPVAKAEDDSKAKASASVKAIDPSLALLFESSAGPVKVPSQKERKEAESQASKAPAPSSENDSAMTDALEDPSDAEESAPEDGIDEGLSLVNRSLKREESVNDHRHPLGETGRKRKRKAAETSAEDKYMEKLTRQKPKLQNELTHDLDKATSNGLDTQSQESDATSTGSPAPTPQHESLGTTQEPGEIEKSNRTVFLSNVSSSAIVSKSARKTLVKHLTSYEEKFSSKHPREPPLKVDSLRFRSTAFSTMAIPKKAAFAKQQVMDATTKSTNAYAVYSSASAAREAAKSLNGTVVLDRHIRVDSVAHPSKVDNKRCVFVGNLGFVDDESQLPTGGDEADRNKTKSQNKAGDVEEGLWRQFGKAGEVESVRVVRDPHTRIGKGFAYVQFHDANAVEQALTFHEQKFPPLLPRKIRVTRAKNIRKTTSAKPSSSMRDKNSKRADGNSSHYRPKVSSKEQSMKGRAGKLLGRAGAANFDGEMTRKPAARTDNREGPIVFEGHRASERGGKPAINLGGKRQRQSKKPTNRSTKRAAAWKTSGAKAKR